MIYHGLSSGFITSFIWLYDHDKPDDDLSHVYHHGFIIMDGLSWFFMVYCQETSHFWTNHETSRWMINPSAANLRASLRRGGLEMVGQKSLVFMAKWLGSMDVHPSQLMIQFQPWFHRCFYLFWYSSDLRFHWSQVWSRPVVGVSGLAHGQMEDEMGHTKHLKWQQLGRDQIAGCLFFFFNAVNPCKSTVFTLIVMTLMTLPMGRSPVPATLAPGIWHTIYRNMLQLSTTGVWELT